MSNVDLLELAPLAIWPKIPSTDIAVGTGPDQSYKPAETFRVDWVQVGSLVYVPRWEAGRVLHWEIAKITKITVSFKIDRTPEPWFVCQFADESEQGQYAYSLATHSVVNALDIF